MVTDREMTFEQDLENIRLRLGLCDKVFLSELFRQLCRSNIMGCVGGVVVRWSLEKIPGGSKD